MRFDLLAIGDRRQATPESALSLARAGGTRVALVLRDPALSPAALAGWAEAVIAACRPEGAGVIVHGSVEVAWAAGADGVHLPEGADLPRARSLAGPDLLLGASRHDERGVREAAEAGADYVTLSPVYATPGKGEPLGIDRLAAIVRSTPLPVVALGGITPERAAECRAAGVAAVAAIRAVWTADPGESARLLL